MSDFWKWLFETQEFRRQLNYGSSWSASLEFSHIVADLLIWTAFVTIPILLGFFWLRRRKLSVPRVGWLFLAFMLTAGLLHLLQAASFWWPAYRFILVIKVLMACVSWATVAALIPLVPRLLERRAPEELDAQISERRKAEQALRESEAAYQSLVESLPLNVFRKDLNGVFIDANHRFCETLGQPLEKIVGKTDFDFFPAAQAGRYRRGDQHVIATGESLEDIEEYVKPGGGKLWIQVLKAPVYDAQGQIVGAQGMFWDVTERMLADEAVRKSDARFRKLVESSLIGVMVAHLDGRIIEANDALLHMIGYDRADLQAGNIRWDALTPEDNRAGDERAIGLLLSVGTCPAYEKEYLHRDGHRVPILLGVTMLEGSTSECICFVVDITRQKQTEAELKAAKSAADAASRAKSEFLANMSHEVRTPLNAIIGMTELVLSSPLPVKQAEYLRMVLQSGESLLEVINDVLDFSKVESGKVELENLPFGLRECIGDAVKSLALRAHAKGLELALDVRNDVPEWLLGDSGRLRQVVINLVGNAIKFTAEGEVVVTVERMKEESERREGEILLHITVSDTGIGIPAAKLKKVFEAFEQADTSTTRQYGGTGLGLAIVQRLVELMGGQAWVESEIGAGSKFHLTASFQVCDEPPTDRSAPRRGAMRGTRALIVDDNSTNRRILSEVLKNWELLPTECSSVDAALAMLRQAHRESRPFELLISDVNMPHRDGFELVEEIRRDSELAELIVMLLTSGERPDHGARCEELNVSQRLMKPVKQSELQQAIAAALGIDKAEPEIIASSDELHSVPPRPLKILLAEDSLVNQRLAIGLLERHGHQLTVANNGREAMEALACDAYDLILMDVQMPEIDGLETTRRIRQMEAVAGGHMPIIAMTAHALKGDRERCLEAGMDEYVAKPVRERQLLAAMRAVLGDSVARPAASTETGGKSASQQVLDWDAALDICNGDHALLRDIVEAFLEEHPRRVVDIRTAIDTANFELLNRSAHTLKGSCRYFCAQAVHDPAFGLEQLGTNRSLEGAEAIFDLLKTELAKLVPHLVSYVQGRGGPGK